MPRWQKNTWAFQDPDSSLCSLCCVPKSLRARLKDGGPGAIFTVRPLWVYDVSHDVIFCKNYVFADFQRSPLLFPVVENVLGQLYVQLAARREFKHWSVFLLLKTFHRLETDSARNNIHPNNKQEPEIQKNTPENKHNQHCQIAAYFLLRNFALFSSWRHYKFRHHAS